MRILEGFVYIFLINVLMVTPSTAKDEVFEAEPKLRWPSVMPPRATESGYCCMAFDLDKYGRTQNVEAAFCTNTVFLESSLKATKKWRYYPKTVNGEPAPTKNLSVYLSYRLTTRDGALIKNADGYPHFDIEGKHMDEHYCSEYMS